MADKTHEWRGKTATIPEQIEYLKNLDAKVEAELLAPDLLPHEREGLQVGREEIKQRLAALREGRPQAAYSTVMLDVRRQVVVSGADVDAVLRQIARRRKQRG